jgi:hypothetical protein
MLKRYLEHRTNINNDKHFPFPLNKGENDVDSRLTNEHNIIVGIKSDPILFRSFSDLLWKIFFKNNEASYDDFLSFNGWIGEKVFDTTNLLACKVDAMNATNKRKRDEMKETPQLNNISASSTGTASNMNTTTSIKTAVSTGDCGKSNKKMASTSKRTMKNATGSTDYNGSDLIWTELSPAAKIHASELGYSQRSWDSIESLSSFSTKQIDLKSSQKLAVSFLFNGEWPPLTQKLWNHKHFEVFESSFNCSKSDLKAGECDCSHSIANGRQKRTRYFFNEPNDDGTWQAYRINEKKQSDGKITCGCPFCQKQFGPQGIQMHM